MTTPQTNSKPQPIAVLVARRDGTFSLHVVLAVDFYPRKGERK